MKRYLLLPVACLLLTTSSALAQESSYTLVAQNQPGHFIVYFPLGRYTLDAEGRAAVSAAAEDYKRTGSARISVRGYTDTSGSPELNQALSERRSQAVANELIQLGVPAEAITGEALGETQLAVPTPDGVREAENRRVEIDVEQPAPPPEVAPAPAPAPEPAPPVAEAPPPEPKRFFVSAGAFYGFDMGEGDDHDHTSHLAGANFSFDYAVMPWASVGVEQAVFYHFASDNNGAGGRTLGSLDFHFGGEVGLARFDPYIGGNIGYLYGAGIDDSAFAGPEIGFVVDWFTAKVAYDMPFDRGAGDGVVNTTIGAGFRF